MVRFRTLGCYPLTGAIRSDAGDLPSIIMEMQASRTSEREGRLIDSDRSARWRKRSRRGTSDVGSAHDRLHRRTALDAWLAEQTEQGPAALPHLRLGRRRQVDADRPAALRQPADPRRPARHAPQGEPQPHHGRRGHRFLAAGRRADRRARAGHHHRCRLPVLFDRQAQVHRRRYAGPRAVHPQHGDRRLERRSRHRADRCAQGRADADPPPQLHPVA